MSVCEPECKQKAFWVREGLNARKARRGFKGEQNLENNSVLKRIYATSDVKSRQAGLLTIQQSTFEFADQSALDYSLF